MLTLVMSICRWRCSLCDEFNDLNDERDPDSHAVQLRLRQRRTMALELELAPDARGLMDTYDWSSFGSVCVGSIVLRRDESQSHRSCLAGLGLRQTKRVVKLETTKRADQDE